MKMAPGALFDIQWPADGELTVRKLVSRSRSIPNGKQWSVKLRRMTQWESRAECYGQQLVDACPAIQSYCEQPLRLWYLKDGNQFSHVPDLMVHASGRRPWIIEFKSDDDRKLAEAYERAITITPMFDSAGFDYFVVLESQLLTASYRENAKYLLRYGRSAATEVDYQFALSLFEATGDLSLRSFCRAYESEQAGLRAASRLVLSGYVSLDMSTPITEATVLSFMGRFIPPGGLSWLQAAFAVTR